MKLDPSKTAFLFPGQGSQAVGMGAELATSYPTAADTFRQADGILDIPLSELLWEGPEEQLNDTVNTQPALLVHSVAVLRVFRERFPDFHPRFVAGHSMGEFSALVAAGSLSFEDALLLVRERGRAMKAAGEQTPGGMAAILGLGAAEVQTACEEASQQSAGGVWLANDNCPGQIVISGDDQALTIAGGLLKEAGARKVVPLAVSIAAHSPFMVAAENRLRTAMAQAEIADPRIPVIGNVSAQPLATAEAVRQDLEAQLTSTVRWTESIEIVLAAGVADFVEFGSGSVLTGMVKRIDRSAGRHNLDSPASFEAFLN